MAADIGRCEPDQHLNTWYGELIASCHRAETSPMTLLAGILGMLVSWLVIRPAIIAGLKREDRDDNDV